MKAFNKENLSCVLILLFIMISSMIALFFIVTSLTRLIDSTNSEPTPKNTKSRSTSFYDAK